MGGVELRELAPDPLLLLPFPFAVILLGGLDLFDLVDRLVPAPDKGKRKQTPKRICKQNLPTADSNSSSSSSSSPAEPPEVFADEAADPRSASASRFEFPAFFMAVDFSSAAVVAMTSDMAEILCDQGFNIQRHTGDGGFQFLFLMEFVWRLLYFASLVALFRLFDYDLRCDLEGKSKNDLLV